MSEQTAERRTRRCLTGLWECPAQRRNVWPCGCLEGGEPAGQPWVRRRDKAARRAETARTESKSAQGGWSRFRRWNSVYTVQRSPRAIPLRCSTTGMALPMIGLRPEHSHGLIGVYCAATVSQMVAGHLLELSPMRTHMHTHAHTQHVRPLQTLHVHQTRQARLLAGTVYTCIHRLGRRLGTRVRLAAERRSTLDRGLLHSSNSC